MQVAKINGQNNQNFGHSFRVSICLKDAEGISKFVNPAEDKNLYQKLNSKIVNWLNEEYYTNLRNLYGIARKTERIKPQSDIHKEMSAKLREIDKDYAKFNVVRSVYRRNTLGYIATGADVSIIENLKGVKNIGLAKADSKWTYGHSYSDYVKALSKAVKNNTIAYVTHDNVLLRSPRNKEIMLKTVFKKIFDPKAKDFRYELDDFEFHENYTKRTLAPVNSNFARFKQSRGMLEEIKKTIEYHVNKITGKRTHFEDIDEILNPKFEKPAVKKSDQHKKQATFIRKEPKQMELKFEE